MGSLESRPPKKDDNDNSASSSSVMGLLESHQRAKFQRPKFDWAWVLGKNSAESIAKSTAVEEMSVEDNDAFAPKHVATAPRLAAEVAPAPKKDAKRKKIDLTRVATSAFAQAHEIANKILSTSMSPEEPLPTAAKKNY